jgi:diguanylate cyclase (GGDEF)-like protein
LLKERLFNRADLVNWNKYTKSLFVIFCFTLALGIGAVRYLTGPELALSLFYLFPIGLATWYGGMWIGVFMSLISALSWLAADIMMLDSFSSILIPFLNETFRLIVFLVVTYIISRLKTTIDNHKKLARTDHLTGITNRRAFFDLANLELSKARRYQTPISILYLDIDNFKHINDQFGHHIGDRLLRSVAKTIKNNIRAIDVIARFGGDEFGILLAETGSESAALVARKLKEKLGELLQHNGWPVTFSTGVVTFEIIPVSIDEMIDAADAQMYLAKQNGKNRTRYKVITNDEGLVRSIVNL